MDSTSTTNSSEPQNSSVTPNSTDTRSRGPQEDTLNSDLVFHRSLKLTRDENLLVLEYMKRIIESREPGAWIDPFDRK